MKIVCIQHDIVWQDKAATHARVLRLLENARLPQGSLVLLAEMFATGFSMDVQAVAETADGPTHRFLAEAAKSFGLFIAGGVVTRAPDGRGRNEAAVFSPGGVEMARYRKLHPFTLGNEHACYARGDEIVMFNWQGATVAPFICYDLRFPEIFRAAVRRGAQVMAVIANWPLKREEHWMTLLCARAIENQAYVIGVNRCGVDPNLTYGGRSMIVGPDGQILADAGREEGVISADVDMAGLAEYRRKFPVLADMREGIS